MFTRDEINEVITSAAPQVTAYPQYVSPVVDALFQAGKEYAAHLADEIRAEAGRQGSRAGVEQFLLNVGLVEPEPQVEASDEQAPAWAQSLISQVESLARLARGLGVRV